MKMLAGLGSPVKPLPRAIPPLISRHHHPASFLLPSTCYIQLSTPTWQASAELWKITPLDCSIPGYYTKIFFFCFFFSGREKRCILHVTLIWNQRNSSDVTFYHYKVSTQEPNHFFPDFL